MIYKYVILYYSMGSIFTSEPLDLVTTERIRLLNKGREEIRLKLVKKQQEEQRITLLKEQEYLKFVENQKLKLLEEQKIKLLEKQKLDYRLKLIEDIFIEIDLQIRNHRNFNSKNPLIYKCQLSQINLKNTITDICNNDITLKKKLFDYTTSNNKLSFLNLIKSSTILIIHSDNQISVKYLTPFQGADTHRVFGHFKCNDCNKWTSASSWKNKWQKCKKCNCKIYPYHQHLLKKDNSITQPSNKLPHDRERCEKCIENGKLCCPSIYY